MNNVKDNSGCFLVLLTELFYVVVAFFPAWILKDGVYAAINGSFLGVSVAYPTMSWGVLPSVIDFIEPLTKMPLLELWIFIGLWIVVFLIFCLIDGRKSSFVERRGWFAAPIAVFSILFVSRKKDEVPQITSAS